MNQEIMDKLDLVLSKLDLRDGQILRDQGANIDPFHTEILLLDNLTTRNNPLAKINYDFKSIAFTDGTDNNTYVYAIFGRVNESKKVAKFKNNMVYTCDNQTTEITFFSPAQSGKQLTVNIFKDGTFSSGQFIQSGTVSVANPTALIGPTRVTLSAVTATIIAPADTTRIISNIQNKTGADLYVGGSTIGAVGGATEGILVPANGIIVYKNSAALYGWSVAGGVVHRNEET